MLRTDPGPRVASFLAVLLILASAGTAQELRADSTEPVVFTLLAKYGPVIDRAEAAEIGLFKHRPDFAALRFVFTSAGQHEARVATHRRGVMLEQAVPLDSPALARVEEGLLLLRDRGATNVELLLSSPWPLDASGLGKATDARASAAAVCFGALGLGVGMVVGTELTYDESRYEQGWPEWRTKNLGITAAIGAASMLLAGYGGWNIGARADAGRPVAPQPRCAIAGYDDNGYPLYEEEVRAVLGQRNSTLYTIGAIAVGWVAAAAAGGIVGNHLMSMTSFTDPTGLGQGPVVVLDAGIVAVSAYLGNTIGRDLDRGAALDQLRHRPRPQTR